MIKNNGWIVSIIFIALDSMVVYGAFRVATIFRDLLAPLLNNPPAAWESVASVTQLGVFLILGIFVVQGLYPGYGLTAINELEQMGKSITLAFVLLAAAAYLNRPYQVLSRLIFPLAFSLSLTALPLIRFLTRNILSRTKLYGIPVVVLGDSDWGQTVVASLKRVRRLGWRPLALKSVQEFDSQKKYPEASLAILASTPNMPHAELLRSLNRSFRKVVLLREVDNYGSLWVETRDLDGYLGLEFHYHLLSRRNRWLKRSIDIIGALLLLIVLSPLLGFISLLLKLDSPGPIIFQQERLGRDFRRFQVLKFRTMVVGAEEKLKNLLETDPVVRAQYEEFHKLENDPRVTKLGNLFRKYSIDELPQLINVLKGEMSLVGPRAYMTSELDEMETFAPIILRVNPGITGWWQIFGRHSTAFKKRLQLDEYYISNWSLWMDVYIVVKTIVVVLRGTGA